MAEGRAMQEQLPNVSVELTGTKWQESHFAQPKVAQRAKCMDALSEPYLQRSEKRIPHDRLHPIQK